MKVILVIITYVTGGLSIETVEFQSMHNCEIVRQHVKAQEKELYNNVYIKVMASCIILKDAGRSND